ncbi:hypothetical protein ASPBRDRAFT_537628 [Aspergillus brasiliensis CBS 101740]|uniref:Uncharacterized protein n=1 Tax=Aspergillus brasiliensis (strain CBS 101740 / IMI 381727 / IBT 21946) TaxID=767769 RepID=A0A1L9UL53_ASPBC|nr:hypothetical protein ASPBRDRAFT_537628 [Aspergillus brasiliensis CBS 101740]
MLHYQPLSNVYQCKVSVHEMMSSFLYTKCKGLNHNHPIMQSTLNMRGKRREGSGNPVIRTQEPEEKEKKKERKKERKKENKENKSYHSRPIALPT